MNMPKGEQQGSTLALFMCGWSCSIPDEKCSSYQRVRPLDQKMILRLNFARVPKKGYHLTQKKKRNVYKIPNRQKKTNKNWTGLENALWFMGGHALFKSCTLSRICVISRNANSRMDGIGSVFGDDATECLPPPQNCWNAKMSSVLVLMMMRSLLFFRFRNPFMMIGVRTVWQNIHNMVLNSLLTDCQSLAIYPHMVKSIFRLNTQLAIADIISIAKVL